MSPRWQVITHHWRRTVVLLSVALLLAWNFATIAHQLDLIPEHHSHHHCQMFAGSHHGLAKAQPELLPQLTSVRRILTVSKHSLTSVMYATLHVHRLYLPKLKKPPY